MSIKGRNTCIPNFLASRIRVPGGKRIEDCLPLLCSFQSIRAEGQANTRRDGDQPVAPSALQGRLWRGRGAPLQVSVGPPLGLRTSHAIVLQSSPQGTVKCARHRVAQMRPLTSTEFVAGGVDHPHGPSLGSMFMRLLPDAMRPAASARVLASRGMAFGPFLFFLEVKCRT